MKRRLLSVIRGKLKLRNMGMVMTMRFLINQIFFFFLHQRMRAINKIKGIKRRKKFGIMMETVML